MSAKRAEEAQARAFLAAYPRVTADLGDPGRISARAQATYRSTFLESESPEDHAGSISDLFDYACRLVCAANAGARPDLASPPAGHRAECRRARRGAYRSGTLHGKTKSNPTATILPCGECSAANRSRSAARLARGPRSANPAVRRALWAAANPPLAAPSDPLIRFASAIEADAQAIGERYRNEVAGPMANAET